MTDFFFLNFISIPLTNVVNNFIPWKMSFFGSITRMETSGQAITDQAYDPPWPSCRNNREVKVISEEWTNEASLNLCLKTSQEITKNSRDLDMRKCVVCEEDIPSTISVLMYPSISASALSHLIFFMLFPAAL